MALEAGGASPERRLFWGALVLPEQVTPPAVLGMQTLSEASHPTQRVLMTAEACKGQCGPPPRGSGGAGGWRSSGHTLRAVSEPLRCDLLGSVFPIGGALRTQRSRCLQSACPVAPSPPLPTAAVVSRCPDTPLGACMRPSGSLSLHGGRSHRLLGPSERPWLSRS